MSIIFLALVQNLLLVFTLNQYSYNLGFINLKCQLTKSGQVITTVYKENNLYILDALPFIPECVYIVTTNNINTLIKSTDASAHYAFTTSTSSSTGTITIWHCYLGHIMLRSVKKLFQKNIMKSMHATDSDSYDSATCKACLKSKQIQSPIPKISDIQNLSILYRVYLDFVGPIKPQDRGGEYYFMIFLDGYSYYLKIVLLKSNSSHSLNILRLRQIIM